MDTLSIAGFLCFILGIIHSVLGEYLIFQHKRESGKLVPTKGSGLKERHLRILWATWHLASLFGWCIGAILLTISLKQDISEYSAILQTIMYTMLIASLLVLVGTKGKHPGWIVLLAIGILVFFGY